MTAPLIVSTPSAAAAPASARATSSLNAMWASGSPSRASKCNCSSRTASLSAAVVDRHAQDRLRQLRQRLPGADALDETARPAASATVRRRPSPCPGRGSTSAMETPRPSACLTAAANDKPRRPGTGDEDVEDARGGFARRRRGGRGSWRHCRPAGAGVQAATATPEAPLPSRLRGKGSAALALDWRVASPTRQCNSHRPNAGVASAYSA